MCQGHTATGRAKCGQHQAPEPVLNLWNGCHRVPALGAGCLLGGADSEGIIREQLGLL